MDDDERKGQEGDDSLGEEEHKPSYLLDVSLDTLVYCFHFLPVEDIFILPLVCKYLEMVLPPRVERLWRSLCIDMWKKDGRIATCLSPGALVTVAGNMGFLELLLLSAHSPPTIFGSDSRPGIVQVNIDGDDYAHEVKDLQQTGAVFKYAGAPPIFRDQQDWDARPFISNKPGLAFVGKIGGDRALRSDHPFPYLQHAPALMCT